MNMHELIITSSTRDFINSTIYCRLEIYANWPSFQISSANCRQLASFFCLRFDKPATKHHNYMTLCFRTASISSSSSIFRWIFISITWPVWAGAVRCRQRSAAISIAADGYRQLSIHVCVNARGYFFVFYLTVNNYWQLSTAIDNLGGNGPLPTERCTCKNDLLLWLLILTSYSSWIESHSSAVAQSLFKMTFFIIFKAGLLRPDVTRPDCQSSRF